jgi:hypothetical protein
MAETADLQSDQFMTLLTDALRSGPGSPEWHQAVRQVRAANPQAAADEYAMLCAARERLEAGKEYRSVRPGPGFTRKVMASVDEEGRNGPGGVPTANVIALLAAGAILGVVVVIGVILLRGGGVHNGQQQQKVEELGGVIFGNKFLSATFGGPASNVANAPEGWVRFGELALVTKNGELRPSTQPAAGDPKAYKAGGIVTVVSIPADQPLEVDAVLRLSRGPEDGIVQVLVSDEPIGDENAAGAHALVWQLKSGEARAFLADGQATPQGERITGPREVAVKMALNRETTVVEAAGKRLYAGPHLLDPAKPRYAGVRFLRRGEEKWDNLGVVAVTLQKP